MRLIKKLVLILPLTLITGVLEREANAQSANSLIDKLIEKGVLTVKEANELREEADKDFDQAYSVKNGMRDWVNSLKLNGDARLRYEGFYSDATYGTTNRSKFVNRNRFRYRIRFGVTASMTDNLEAGFRLTSGDPTSGFSNNSGNPVSGNSTFQDNGSKKFVYFDTAYLKWSPVLGPDWSTALILGKMDNPFDVDEMVLDRDYTPEGAALQATYRLNDRHSLNFTAGAFVLDEFDVSSNDPFLYGAQAHWDAAWTPKLATSLGAAIFDIQNADRLNNTVVPNVNRGNARNADGTLAYRFNPVVVDGGITYILGRAPFYSGPFPIRLGGEYMNNPGAPGGADNYAWNAELKFGKSGKRGTWEVSYMYKWLGANSWWEELVDDDFGAFYGALNSPPNSGANVGNSGGTNVKGHILRLAWSPTDSLTLSVKYFLTDLIHPFPAGSNSEMNRIQVDAMLKF